MIAETARMRTDLEPVAAPDALVAELTQLSSYRTDLMGDWVRGVNQLRAMLASIFPALEAAFDYSNRPPLILVSGLCTPSEIRAAGVEGVTAHLKENGAWAKGIVSMAASAAVAAAEQDIAVAGEATTAVLVKRLARKLLDLDREIKDTELHGPVGPAVGGTGVPLADEDVESAIEQIAALGTGLPLGNSSAVLSPIAHTLGAVVASVEESTGIHPVGPTVLDITAAAGE